MPVAEVLTKWWVRMALKLTCWAVLPCLSGYDQAVTAAMRTLVGMALLGMPLNTCV
jgi:hypothetical protein